MIHKMIIIDLNLDSARDIFSSSVFKPFGRITYCVFLCHTVILRLMLSVVRDPVYVNDLKFVSLS